jgi:hypothetical protein
VASCAVRNSAATGFINATSNILAGTMATFNSLVAGFFHADITTGAAKTLTVRQAMVQTTSPANPQIVNFI